MDFTVIVSFLFLQQALRVCCHGYEEFESTPYDGWYNNLLHPDWGASDTQLLRRSRTAYADGVYQPAGGDRPSPLEISRAAHQGATGRASYDGRTAMMVYFGQQVVEEIVDAQRKGCPIEYFNMEVPKDHHALNPEHLDNLEMPFKRTRYDQRTGFSPNNPRQQLNEITPFIDGQVIYGPNKAWTDAIRAYKGGRLAGTNPGTIQQEFPLNNTIRLPFANPPVTHEHKLRPVSRFQAIGNPRGHENPFLLSFGILWFRWHNRVADTIARDNPNLNDEQIFNIARKRVIALYQKIVFYDWLPLWLDSSKSAADFKNKFPYKENQDSKEIRAKREKKRKKNRRRNRPSIDRINVEAFSSFKGEDLYSGYNPSIHPGIYQEFQSAAMRFGHTLVPPGLWRRAGLGGCSFATSRGRTNYKHYAALRLCNEFWTSREAVEEDIDALFRGMASTIAEREDSIIVPDLTESLFGPLEFSRRDLAAINIQRGRDHGLPDYNTVREAYGLPRKSSWEDINRIYNTQEIAKLKALYKNSSRPDNVDVFTGGLLETLPTGPGELFQTILLEQFLRIRHGDRFWFENTESSGLTKEELEEVWGTSLNDVINFVTGVTFSEIQQNVFIFKSTDSSGARCLQQPKQLFLTGFHEGLQMLEPCSPLKRYDYFSDSRLAFTATFLLAFLTIPVTFLIMYLLAKRRKQTMLKTRIMPQPLERTASSNPNEVRVLEWIDWDEPERIVYVVLEAAEKRISVYTSRKILLRYVDISVMSEKQKSGVDIHLSSDRPENMLALKLQDYDLVLKFYNAEERNRFTNVLDKFLTNFGVKPTKRSLVESYILRNAVTKKHRQERLNRFFKKILSAVQAGDTDVEENMYGTVDEIGPNIGPELSRIELTQAEFGEAFGLKQDSTFVKHMFLLVDADKSGHVSFREFMDIFILLSSDDMNSKVRLLFNMYDINRQGFLSKDDLYNMVKSLLDLSDDNTTPEKISEFAEAVYKAANMRSGQEMTFSDFKRVFSSDKNVTNTLKQATLELNEPVASEDSPFLTVPNANSKRLQRRFTLVRGYSIPGDTPPPRPCMMSQSSSGGLSMCTMSRGSTHTSLSRINQFTDEFRQAPVGWRDAYAKIVGYLETYRLQVFWLTLYVLVTAGIFAERAHYYAVERENGGLRRIAGQGVTISRGSASVIMFTYATLMVTMCKNSITFLRETFFHRFVPFDSLHSLHKFAGCSSLVFTFFHVLVHGVNLYHICTQPPMDLICYFREYYRATHELANFQYWAYGTATGFTGVILSVLVIVLFVFATPYSRRHLFHAFWNTHKLYIFIYILLLIHGSVRMVQEPHFPYYIVGPAVLYIIDKLISTSRTHIELTVIKAELLPSDVTALKVKKPREFEYLSGQWAQVACVELGRYEFHPFTMTSAPHEKFLTFHIRAVGPWTTNLRRVYDPSTRIGKMLPKLLLDGPFGEGHQDWYKFELAVLIGGGIGVTPFVSILKDIVHKGSLDITIACKKVFFLWVTRTQKQFEWVTDIIRELEAIDNKKLVTTHIFVTEFRSRFDLRTSMLYICERHFQKIAGRSLFTGLEATTHFGRPRFYKLLESLRFDYPAVKRIGVFSCGPRPMTLAVENACSTLNKYKTPTYFHHYENF